MEYALGYMLGAGASWPEVLIVVAICVGVGVILKGLFKIE